MGVRRVLGRVAVNALAGLAALLLVNALSPYTGLSLGINVFNLLTVGVLGAPGLGLLVLAAWVL